MRDPGGDRNVLCLHYISDNTDLLIVTLYYGFVRCYCWGKLGKRHARTFIFLITACECIIIAK